jgi:thioredoxin reductase
VCDGPFYAGKNVMVIGDANSALQYAILLAANAPTSMS